jgi:hypothetical protein
MDPSDYCELCDLPRSQCIHGRPPPEAKATPPRKAPVRRKSAPARPPGAPARPVVRRWTPPEAFRPLILQVLAEAGGQLDAEEMFFELELATEDRLLPGDRETTPEGELRGRYAARRARVALIAEGAMTKAAPGVWKLA